MIPAPAVDAPFPADGTGAQEIVVVVAQPPAGLTLVATVDGRSLTLGNSGQGTVGARFFGEPARMATLVLASERGRTFAEAQLPLPDRGQNVVAWEFHDDGLVRAAVAPSALTTLGIDPGLAWAVPATWGGLLLGYVGLLVVAGARRR